MAYGDIQLSSGDNPSYSLRLQHDNDAFGAEIQGYARENEEGQIDEAASDAAFQELLDLMAEFTNFTISNVQKRRTTDQTVTVTPAE